ncbi:MAG TPA: o-succinylbenzoate synthase [Paenisporosarcina sp.]|nr:o-succinylbenzoate synthase [Paenisporosarcina sp.]
MGNIQIKRVTLYHVRVPLKRPFTTHLQEVMDRESILIEMLDDQGNIGVGECVAFSSPWYTEETVETAWLALEQWIIPAILNHTFSHPDELDGWLSFIKRNHMAKSTVNHAIWDIYSQKQHKPLWQVIGGTSRPIEAGIVVAAANEAEVYSDIEAAVSNGYKRIKLKISQSSNPQNLKELIAKYPQTLFFADANGAFTKDTIHVLQQFDECGFTLIEQPFSEQQNKLSALAQKSMKTPFALDESIASIQDVEEMISQQSGKIIVMKQGRVGGLSNALRIHEKCKKADVPIWVGGMIEFGVSKAFNLAFASLPGVTYPGDFSSSNHFWNYDLAEPTINVQHGEIQLSKTPGVGVKLNHKIVDQYEVRRKLFYA